MTILTFPQRAQCQGFSIFLVTLKLTKCQSDPKPEQLTSSILSDRFPGKVMIVSISSHRIRIKEIYIF